MSETVPEKNRILLGVDAWSQRYWTTVAPLSEAIHEIVNGVIPADLADSKYAKYWIERTAPDYPDRTPEQAIEMARTNTEYRIGWTRDILTNGYRDNAWKDDSRPEAGPITINVGAYGELYPWDGMHRSVILRAMGEPVYAALAEVQEDWQATVDYHTKLYTPYPHPMLAGRPVVRKGLDRFQSISNALRQVEAKRICVVGACSGYGALYLSNAGYEVTALEPHRHRSRLLLAWNKIEAKPMEVRIGYSHELDYTEFDAVVGLSVYHHVATSFERWAQVAASLAAAPIQIVELAQDHDPQWHENFREQCEQCEQHRPEICGSPSRHLLEVLCARGGYNFERPQTVYQDASYGHRTTYMFTRK